MFFGFSPLKASVELIMLQAGRQPSICDSCSYVRIGFQIPVLVKRRVLNVFTGGVSAYSVDTVVEYV